MRLADIVKSQFVVCELFDSTMPKRLVIEPNYEYYVAAPGQLKTKVVNKLNYLNNVFINLSELVQKFDSENRQLKMMITVLLHFKHAFHYLKNNLIEEETLNGKLGDEATLFHTDIARCLAQFDQVVGSSQSLKFAQDKDISYESNTKYCSFNEDDLLSLCKQKCNPNKTTSTVKKGRGRPRKSKGEELSNHKLDMRLQNDVESNNDLIDLPRASETNQWANEPFHSDDENDLFMAGFNNTKRDRLQKLTTTISIENSSGFVSNNDKKTTIARKSNPTKRSSEEDEESILKKLKCSTTANDLGEDNDCEDEDEDDFNDNCDNENDNEMNYDDDNDNNEEDLEEYRPSSFKCPIEGCIWEPFDRKKDLNIHLFDGHGIAPFECAVDGCSQGFENKNRMLSHLKEHKDSYVTCEKCKKPFKAIFYPKHIYKKHRKGEYNCPQEGCSFVACYYFQLEKHRNMEHNELMKKHTCSWPDCGRSFINSKDYKEHVRIHVRFKRYVCKWVDCDYASEKRSHVIRHIRSRHLGLPRTVREQKEQNIVHSHNPSDFMEVLPDIAIF